MLNIGMVGGAASYHGRAFAQMFNGADSATVKRQGWPRVFSARVDAGVRITHIWDAAPGHAAGTAEVCGIEHVTDTAEAMFGEVDGIIIPDDGTLSHQHHAKPFLEAGLPVFIDKPLAPAIGAAEALVNLARKHKAPLMSCSAFRFARETEGLRSGEHGLGAIRTGHAVCRTYLPDGIRNGLVFYGIHAVELLVSIVGPGIATVQNAGREGAETCIVTYRDGRRFIISAYDDIAHTAEIVLYGTEGQARVAVGDAERFYVAMLQAFVKMVQTGEEPVPLEETLEVIRTVVRGEESRRKDGEVLRI